MFHVEHKLQQKNIVSRETHNSFPQNPQSYPHLWKTKFSYFIRQNTIEYYYKRFTWNIYIINNMLFSYFLISILQNQLFFKNLLLTFSTTMFHVKQYKKINCVILIKVFHISPDLSTSVENLFILLFHVKHS